MMERRICYYVSGHGFGHATRVSQIVSGFLREDPHLTITLCTKAPRHLYPTSPRITYRSRDIDASVVQSTPYDVDVLATFHALEDFLGADGAALATFLAQETRFLRALQPDLILVDAAWTIGFLQGHAPLVLISNFTFDVIYQTLARHFPATVDASQRERYEGMIGTVVEGYRGFEYLIRLPGSIDFYFLSRHQTHTTVLDAPLIFRPAEAQRETTLRRLNVPRQYWGHKILLVQFGGHSVTATNRVPDLPEGWICLWTTAIEDPRFFTFPASIYLPDLVGASDLVLGKIGYGTVSECVGMAKPLLYVARENFAEEPYLVQYMSEHGTSLELGKEMFERGQWAEHIEKVVIEKAKARECQPRLLQDGSQELARQVLDLIQ